MGIYKISNEFFYGYASKKNYADQKPYKIVISSKIWDRVNSLRSKGFKCEGYREYDPEGKEIIDCWKIIPYDEYKDVEIPRNYPGYYYWVWHNGAFFKVLGETERYVLVDIEECGYEQADALGIPREDVACDYHKEQKVGRWWLKKSEIKMPDELGKGRFIYIYMLNTYLPGRILEVVKKEGSVVRLRYSKIYNVKTVFNEIKESIKNRAFPWYVRNEIQIKEIAENAEAECWKEGDYVYFEFNIDIEIMERWRAKLVKEAIGDTKSEIAMYYYWYGEEEVPYRL